MALDTSDVKNWMNMFRWIVKTIRDEYGVDEAILTRGANIEQDIGLSIEQLEELVSTISKSFGIAFPDGALDELVKLEELCMLSSWMAGLYQRPGFISDSFAAACMASNPLSKPAD
jgi:hypothetical protein